jgi:polar amino acid transport system substrate-binding protein
MSKPLCFKAMLVIKQILILLVVSLIGPVQAEEVTIPLLWDNRLRTEKPDIPTGRIIRVLTDDEFPPFHFTDPDGRPTGFSVELSKAICEFLNLVCTIQSRRFDTLLASLEGKQGDIVAAAIPITTALRRQMAVTFPYHRFAARFAVRKENGLEPSSKFPQWTGKSVAVVAGTSHEAYFKAFFPKAIMRSYADAAEAHNALRQSEVGALFGDGMSLAIWTEGTSSNGCCRLEGGPYLESQYFGEGIGFVMRKDDEILRRAFDYALQRLYDQGVYREIFLKSFPISPY